MAKKTAIKKKTFDIDALSDKFSSKTKYKKDQFIDLGEVFQKATGVPGPAIGHLNVFLGHSDTGKTTALIKAATWCQKNDILPVFIITEKKWSFSHAKLMGFDCDEVSPGDWKGFFLFKVVNCGEHAVIKKNNKKKILDFIIEPFFERAHC